MSESDRPDEDPRDDLEVIGALAEPNRRALYDFVTSQRAWVSRDQAAAAVGLRRGIVAHHLDRLVGDGLVEVDYQRLTDRRGPGAGRPSKLYRRAPADFGVSLPPRRYDLAGDLLAEAADQARLEHTPIDEALALAAGAEGRRMGAEAKDGLGRRTSASARRAGVLEALRRRGFEPEVGGDGVTVLHNCPFQLLAQKHTELVCGMNLDLIDGLLAEVGGTGLAARLEPEPGSCCVRLHPV